MVETEVFGTAYVITSFRVSDPNKNVSRISRTFARSIVIIDNKNHEDSIHSNLNVNVRLAPCMQQSPTWTTTSVAAVISCQRRRAGQGGLDASKRFQNMPRTFSGLTPPASKAEVPLASDDVFLSKSLNLPFRLFTARFRLVRPLFYNLYFSTPTSCIDCTALSFFCSRNDSKGFNIRHDTHVALHSGFLWIIIPKSLPSIPTSLLSLSLRQRPRKCGLQAALLPARNALHPSTALPLCTPTPAGLLPWSAPSLAASRPATDTSLTRAPTLQTRKR